MSPQKIVVAPHGRGKRSKPGVANRIAGRLLQSAHALAPTGSSLQTGSPLGSLGAGRVVLRVAGQRAHATGPGHTACGLGGLVQRQRQHALGAQPGQRRCRRVAWTGLRAMPAAAGAAAAAAARIEFMRRWVGCTAMG